MTYPPTNRATVAAPPRAAKTFTPPVPLVRVRAHDPVRVAALLARVRTPGRLR